MMEKTLKPAGLLLVFVAVCACVYVCVHIYVCVFVCVSTDCVQLLAGI